MSRPLRIEYSGAMYHITSRGIDKREIYSDDRDREHFVLLLKEGAYFLRAEVLCHHGGDTARGRNEYRRYIEEGLDTGLANPIKEAKYQLILGAESFVVL